MKKVYPKIIVGGVKFIPVKGIKKCKRCDKYGRIEVREPSCSGTYYPYCDCEYGQYLKNSDDGLDMFARARRG